MTLAAQHPIPGLETGLTPQQHPYAFIGMAEQQHSHAVIGAAARPWEALSAEKRLHTLDGIVPEARPYFERLMSTARDWGMRPWIISALRTCREQDGLSQSAVRSCKSWHTLGRAIDVQLQSADGKVDDREPYEKLGEWWESIGGTWGGRWERSYPDGIEPFRNAGPGDVVHFQWTPPPLTTSVPPTLCDHSDCEGTRERYLAAEWRKRGGHFPEQWAEGATHPLIAKPPTARASGAQWLLVGIASLTLLTLLGRRGA